MLFFRNLCIYVAMAVLIIIRFFIPSNWWFGTVTMVGFLVALLDLSYGVYKEIKVIKVKRKRRKAAYCFIALALPFLLFLGMSVANMVVEIEWINDDRVKDIITLLTLLIGLQHRHLSSLLSSYIQK